MHHVVVSIFDIKVGSFSKPVCVPSASAAVRAFGDAVNDVNTEYSKHPEDYSIWQIASFNDQTGEFENSEKSQLAQAVALKQVM